MASSTQTAPLSGGEVKRKVFATEKKTSKVSFNEEPKIFIIDRESSLEE
jgi:hypothetical protein